MSLQAVSGPVSHCRVVSHTQGHISAKHGGSIRTSHATTFRVGRQPVHMSGTISVDNGDEVTVVGYASSEGLSGLALRDNDSGLTFVVPTDKRNLFAGVIALFAGLSCGPMMMTDDMGLGGVIMLLIPLGVAWFFIARFRADVERLRTARTMLNGGDALPLPA